MKHGAVTLNWMRNGAGIYTRLLRYEATCMLNLVLSGSVTMRSGKEFYSIMPRGRHKLANAAEEQVIGVILHV